jgi:hypothetical protein
MFTHRLEYRLWRRRRRRRRIILALTAVLLLAAALHGGAGHAHHRHDARKAATSRTARDRHGAARVRPRISGKEGNPAEPRTGTAGTGLRWADFHGIQLPYSATDGPRHTQDGLAWGFADTPRGALLGAVNVAVRTAALWGPRIFGPTIGHQVTGPDAGALLRADLSDYAAMRAAAQVRSGQPAGRGYAAEAAYRFLSFTPAAATVDIVTEGPSSSSATVMTATRIALVWQRGDWRVIAPPGGDWGSSATPVSSLTGFTTFPE